MKKNKDNELIPGQLVKIRVRGFKTMKEGFAVGGYANSELTLELHEKIHLENFPSWNDFFGKTTIVSHNDTAMVIRKVGRPHNRSKDTRWGNYDIYEIITKDQKICQVFKHNIVSIPNKKTS